VDADKFSRLRKSLRQQRRSLSAREQHQAAHRLYQRLIHAPLFLRAKRIAFYFANDGEIDPLDLLLAALRMNKKCYLPVLSRHRPDRVSFVRFKFGDPLLPNRWGILEPEARPRRCVPAASLNLVLMPLVGFDSQGTRLGMGKGFYDRTFQFKRRLVCNRPKLVGLAHSFQQVELLVRRDWDIPLNAVATEQKTLHFPR
jgi:5-formyltetrahydrofolate cyclo-ligase